ncbi:hypothetical protein BC936DRAFT_149788 [Jimgerdemannia flammicorona]|uniref:NodB homology domain-containing protein n=1 Tax=Jimgerdemannia flammicorona TaxID=994334 RepID=A0A433D043_9FUNG|nr:hypothetical protein BC936DRAFT_149788 [Jimgerdemannia flammicorona]
MLTKSIFSAIGLLALTAIPLASAQDSGTGFVFKCNRPGVVALTFDDGPGAYSQELLNILAAKSVKTTYFVIGSNVETASAGLVSEYKAGHQIGLHTYTHPHLNTLTADAQTSEIQKTKDIVKSTIGVTPSVFPSQLTISLTLHLQVYMRPPYGECLETCSNTMRGLGYTVTMWNLDSNDWTFESNLTYAHELYDNIMKGITPSDPTKDSFIILQHEIDEYSVKLVPDIIDAIRAKGYTFDTIAGCTGGAAPYTEGWGTVTGGGSSNGTNTTSSALSSVISSSISANATASFSSILASASVSTVTSHATAPGSGATTSSAPSVSKTSNSASAVSYSITMFVAVVGAVAALAL